MRRAIADSDDDEDDLTSQVNDHNGGGLLPATAGDAQRESVMQFDDQTIEKSTGSTEQLRQNIRIAEQGLCTNSAPEGMDRQFLISSGSPSVQANKRRTASMLGSQTSVSADRGVKRAKTAKPLKTYSARNLAQLNDDAVPGGEAAPKTSQSARFTEHSGVNSSAVLPSGSPQDEFLEHEPNLLFPESGSTVADTSSIQQRVLEQALGPKDDEGISPRSALVPDKQQDSSLPWSASEPDGSMNRNSPPEAAHNGDLTDAAVETNAAASGKDYVDLTNGTPNAQERPAATTTDLSQPAILPGRASHILKSPTVEIQRRKSDAALTGRDASASFEKPQKGRKRKAEEYQDPDILISDDRPIDLPAEQYKPRPSRRRATEIVQEPIDFSVRPERAAKVKRNKTTEGPSHSQVATSLEKPTTAPTIINLDIEKVKKAQTDASDSAGHSSCNESRVIQKHSERKHAITQDLDPTKQGSVLQKESQEVAAGRKPDEPVFSKPAKSLGKKKLISKTKRSQTTIFEDHVDFRGSQSSPSLIQQQANRQSALQTVDNDAMKSRKIRRNVIADDDDDDDEEDEDAREEAQEHTSPPKKRQRGRPPKSTAKTQTDSGERSQEQSNANEDRAESDGAPKARGRGRPPKTSIADASMTETETPVDPPLSDLPSTDAQAHATHYPGHVETTKVSDVGGVSVTEATSTKLATPSQEKPEVPRKAANASPSSHSPIKTTLKVPLRVGLSNRQRIPSLLRTMNPKR